MDLASGENWQKRLSKIEREAQEKTDRKVAETLEQMNDRHIKVLNGFQTHGGAPAAALVPCARAGGINQDPAHGLGGDSHVLRAALARELFLIRHAHPGLVHQGRGLQCVLRAFPAHEEACQPPQFGVGQLEQTRSVSLGERFGTTRAPKDASNFGLVLLHRVQDTVDAQGRDENPAQCPQRARGTGPDG
jgi:hypothetical protein